MEVIARTVFVYLFLLLIFRITGHRTMAQLTSFDLVVLLVVGDVVQQGLLGESFSVTNSAVVIVTLFLLDIGFSLWKQRSPLVERLIEGAPLIVVDQGKPLKDRMDKVRVDEEDILEAARETHGLERLDQIKYAVVEKSGDISIIPRGKAA